ncbi:MAG: 50S ribosomal protein L25 [Candidatus Doudnabacteria bacterium]|nr:50S ribosomal protein L25 [Candidatus Doudnabacteria bacterium]
MTATTISLEASPREATGRRANQALREEGRVAGVLYGVGTEPTILSVDSLDFKRTYERAGEAQVVTLTLNGAEHPVLIKEIAFDPRNEAPIHVDFWRIDLTKEITAPVPVAFMGTSSAVRDEGGTLVRVITELEIKAVPTALPRELVVDISALKTFEDAIVVGDIVLPEGAEIIGHGENDTVATVEAPRTEAEMEALDEAVEGDVASVEGVEKEEGEEGAAEGDEKKEGGDDAAEAAGEGDKE